MMTKEIKSLYQLTKKLASNIYFGIFRFNEFEFYEIGRTLHAINCKLGDIIPERIQAVIAWLFFFFTSILFIGALWALLVLADAAGAVM